MISQRIFARTAERFAAQRSITTRNVARRTYATEPNASGFKGAQDNPFNRERAAVKAHAAQTSGESIRYSPLETSVDFPAMAPSVKYV